MEVSQNSHLERTIIVHVQSASEDKNLEKKPTSSKTNSSGCFGISKWEVEESLKGRLNDIESEINSALSPRKMVWVALPVFFKEGKKEPTKTFLKCLAIAASIGMLHTTFTGSWACLSTYRIGNYKDLYSSDPVLASNATILFSNTGQGITFLVEGVKCCVIPSFFLLRDIYDKAKCQCITNIYSQQILLTENDQEKEFLYKKANLALASCKGYIAETEEIDITMIEIEEEKRIRLSKKNLLRIMGSQFLQNVYSTPWKMAAKISIFGISALCLHPLVIGTIGCLNGYRLENPSDVHSSDPEILSNAFNLFSNTGHTVEYLYTGMILVGGSARILGNYKKIMHGIIGDIYDKHIRNQNLSIKTKDFLFKKKHCDLDVL
jgi:hypothetical protein